MKNAVNNSLFYDNLSKAQNVIALVKAEPKSVMFSSLMLMCAMCMCYLRMCSSGAL